MQGTIYTDSDLNIAPSRGQSIKRRTTGLFQRIFKHTLFVISLPIIAMVTLPLVYLFIRGIGTGDEVAIEYLLRPRTIEIMLNSLWLVVAVTISAGAIGIPFAWLTTRSDLPLRRMWLILGLLAIVIPSYLASVSYLAVFGPVGYLRDFLEPIFGVRRLPDIRGFFGAWLSITMFAFPYVVLPVRAALMKTDPALEEAAQSMGLNRWQVFWRVTFPQLRPAMASGMLLAGMYALSDFGAVAIMRYNAFTRAIFLQINGFHMDRAALLALVLVAFTLLLFFMEWRINRGQHNYRVGTGTRRTLKPVELGIWKVPALIFCALVVTIGVILPVAVMTIWFFTNVGLESPIPIMMTDLVSHTAGVSVISALVVAIVALPLALLVVRNNSVVNRWIVGLAYTGNILPGIVIALALVFFASNYVTNIYQTLPLLVIGYMTRFLPFSISATRSALTQINPKVEEAARSLGKNPLQVLWHVTVPLARTGIIAGAALVFLSVMKELPTTLILRPIGYETFSTRIWQFYDEAFLPLIGLPGMVLMLISAFGLIIILWRNENHQH
ncbi:MAG: iron ABC transporter permease [Chloroflexota bacterium]